MLSAQMLPALLLLLGALNVLAAETAVTLALAVALAGLFIGVGYACRRAGAAPRQAAASITVAMLFATVIVLLKIFVHG